MLKRFLLSDSAWAVRSLLAEIVCVGLGVGLLLLCFVLFFQAVKHG